MGMLPIWILALFRPRLALTLVRRKTPREKTLFAHLNNYLNGLRMPVIDYPCFDRGCRTYLIVCSVKHNA